MKYVKQFGIISAITLAAECIGHLLPLPIPASIYGLLILLFLLISGLVKVDAVKETANFLIEIMPLMFIPAAAGLLDSYQELQGILIPMAAVVVVTTVAVMAITGICAQWIIGGKKHE